MAHDNTNATILKTYTRETMHLSQRLRTGDPLTVAFISDMIETTLHFQNAACT